MTDFFVEINASDPSRWARELFALGSDYECIVVTDVRLKSDVAALGAESERLGYEFLMVKVRATDEVKRKLGWVYDAEVDNSITEHGLDDYDNWFFEYQNEGTIDSAIGQAQSLIKKLDV